jgi:outer membrane immunogenic protein
MMQHLKYRGATMLRLFGTASAFALMVGAAHAADIPIYEPPPAMVSPTPIAYNWSGFYIGAHGGYGFGDGIFDDGAVIGGQIGVNWQFNSFVLGAEGDGSWADIGASDALGTARLRGGLAFDRFMVYATGGAAFDDWEDAGWVVGGGGEYAFTDNITGGVEYLYYDFDGDNVGVIRGRVNVKFNSFLGG